MQHLRTLVSQTYFRESRLVSPRYFRCNIIELVLLRMKALEDVYKCKWVESLKCQSLSGSSCRRIPGVDLLQCRRHCWQCHHLFSHLVPPDFQVLPIPSLKNSYNCKRSKYKESYVAFHSLTRILRDSDTSSATLIQCRCTDAHATQVVILIHNFD